MPTKIIKMVLSFKHTHYKKHTHIKGIYTASMNSTDGEKAAPKCDISKLCQLSPSLQPPQTTTTIPTPPLGPPSAGCMSLEVASDVSSSTGQRASAVGPWWMWLVWETIRCVWKPGVCGAHGAGSARPAQTHQMTRKQPTGPLPGPFACPSHTPTIKRDAWRWGICAASGPG